ERRAGSIVRRGRRHRARRLFRLSGRAEERRPRSSVPRLPGRQRAALEFLAERLAKAIRSSLRKRGPAKMSGKKISACELSFEFRESLVANARPWNFSAAKPVSPSLMRLA